MSKNFWKESNDSKQKILRQLEAEVEGLWATIVPPSAVEQVEKLMKEFRQHWISVLTKIPTGMLCAREQRQMQRQ